MHVGHVGEVFVDQRRPMAFERGAVGDCHYKASHQTGIDQLSRRQPLGIGVSASGDRAVHHRHQIGRRRAHVYEQGRACSASGKRGAGKPVGRCDIVGMLTRGLRRDEAAPAGIERHPRRCELAHRQRRQLLDAVDAGRERISQLAGHGDGVKICRPDPALLLRRTTGRAVRGRAGAGRPLARRRRYGRSPRGPL